MNSVDQEAQVKKLKRVLEGWRMAILPMKSVILWEQPWHPGVLVAVTTVFYIFLWLLDLNFLTTIAVCGLLINFADFIVPIICNSLYGQASWTGLEEKQYENACRSVIASYNKILDYISGFISLRESSPSMYYLISLSLLCLATWISSCISNLVLMYLTVTLALLWPGLQHRGLFNLVLSLINKPKKFD